MSVSGWEQGSDEGGAYLVYVINLGGDMLKRCNEPIIPGIIIMYNNNYT